MDFLTGVFFVVVSDVPKGSSGQEEYGQTDGNPMIEPVRSPALRLPGCRAAGHGRCNGQWELDFSSLWGFIAVPLALYYIDWTRGAEAPWHRTGSHPHVRRWVAGSDAR